MEYFRIVFWGRIADNQDKYRITIFKELNENPTLDDVVSAIFDAGFVFIELDYVQNFVTREKVLLGDWRK